MSRKTMKIPLSRPLRLPARILREKLPESENGDYKTSNAKKLSFHRTRTCKGQNMTIRLLGYYC